MDSSDTPSAPAATKRQEIIDSAYRVFYDGGFHATGVDAVVADTGISKRTLYKYFPSKEHLIEAVLEHYGETVRDSLFQQARERSPDPRQQILAIFAIRREAMDNSDCQGCLAMKAAQEYRGKHDGIEARGKGSAVYVEDRFAELCTQAGLKDANSTAKIINLLFQGAVATSQMRHDTTAFDTARATVEPLLAV